LRRIAQQQPTGFSWTSSRSTHTPSALGQLDILVVGSRGYGPVRRLVLGSTADYLERHARCSLLVLPRAAIRSLPQVIDR
jgi:hypothetical protein